MPQIKQDSCSKWLDCAWSKITWVNMMPKKLGYPGLGNPWVLIL